MTDEKSCAVMGCAEPATANCASGRCFCAAHSVCGVCRVALANGELQRALVRAGGIWDEKRAVSLLKAKGWDPRAEAEVNAAIEHAIWRLGDDPKLRLLHGQGEVCRLPAVSTAMTETEQCISKQQAEIPGLLF